MSDPERRRQLVMDAEVLPFTAVEVRKLLPLLRRFIHDRRESNEEDDIVAVGSAMRKYVMNIPIEELSTLADLFDPPARTPIPCEIELELAKTLVWKLAAEPLDASEKAPKLEDWLKDLAETYLKGRLIHQRNYSAIALNAVLAIPLLRSQHAPAILAKLRDLEVPWFTELVVRRAEQLAGRIKERVPAESFSGILKGIVEMAAELKQPAV